jgi:spermidine/putrescine transport system ATP-binding protein
VIQQVGDAAAIYDRPATCFVASFVGENNWFFRSGPRRGGAHAVVDTSFGLLRGGPARTSSRAGRPSCSSARSS